MVRSLQEGGEELLTFFQFPKRQWKTLRTTNVIERLNEEFRRRVKTQGALPTEDAALVLLFGLVVSGQIRLRRLDGWRQIPAMLREHRAVGRMTHRALAPGSRSTGRPISGYPPESALPRDPDPRYFSGEGKFAAKLRRRHFPTLCAEVASGCKR